MKIVIGSDHGGFELKEHIIAYLKAKAIEVDDCGTYTNESVDYPEYAEKVANKVVAGEAKLGILVCGTGIGIGIAANKVKGIRAVMCSDVFSARMSREHNDANILSIGGRVLGVGLAEMIVDAFLNTEFEGGRHQRRVDKIMALENK